jgi:preprotein translocase subunit SecA
MVSRSIERAQKQVEQRNFEIRRHLLEYDDVNNAQRQEVYGLRRDLLEGKEQKAYMLGKGREILDLMVQDHLAAPDDAREPRPREVEPFVQQVKAFFGFDPGDHGIDPSAGDLGALAESIWQVATTLYDAKEQRIGPDLMRQYERHILLQIIDAAWKDHLLAMDHLKDGIGLRAYGQRDPLIEYKRESFEMFGQMKERIENDAVRFLFRMEPMTEDDRARQEAQRRREQEQIFASASRSAAGVTARGGVVTVKHKTAKVGRNDPCPCGSGKKFKRCHG